MAGCTITSGRGYFCGGQVGGIKKIFLANYYDASKLIGVTASNTTGVVSALATADNNALTMFEFDLDRQSSSFNQTILTGKGGAVAYQSEFEFQLSHDSQESWARMQNIVEGLWQMIVLDNNGVYYLVGLDNGVEVTGGTYAHGGDVAFGDYVGYVVNMVGAEPVPAFNLSTTSPFVTFPSQLTLSSAQYDEAQV
jgi:hypothetical protein